MNVVIGFIALIGSTYIGYSLSKKFAKRKIFYFEFNEFNNKIKNEISYSQNTIFYVLKSKTKGESDFYNCLTNVIIYKNSFNFEKKYIGSDEIEFFSDYIANVGGGDKISQNKFLENASDYLKEKCKSSDVEEKKFKKLYIKLGFLIGLVIFIVLI